MAAGTTSQYSSTHKIRAEGGNASLDDCMH
jgi:hypothetical protein